MNALYQESRHLGTRKRGVGQRPFKEGDFFERRQQSSLPGKAARHCYVYFVPETENVREHSMQFGSADSYRDE